MRCVSQMRPSISVIKATTPTSGFKYSWMNVHSLRSPYRTDRVKSPTLPVERVGRERQIRNREGGTVTGGRSSARLATNGRRE